MPIVERYPYTPQHLHTAAKQSPRPVTRAVLDLLPPSLAFNDAESLLAFIESLTSPKQLGSVSSFAINFSFPCDTRQPKHHNLVMGISVLLRHLVHLSELTLNWEGIPSSVFNTATVNLTYFESNVEVDDTVISFLNVQREITFLDLKNWGAHLPPRSGSTSSKKTYPIPIELAPSSLPHLAEFVGHAEVASQLASSRPLKAVSLKSGLDAHMSGDDWREIMSGLGESTHWVSHLSIGPLPTFSLEMLASVGRHLQALETLHVAIQRYPYSQEVFHWDYWKNYVLPLVELESVEVEMVDTTPKYPINLPTIDHLQSWHRTCPLLREVTVKRANGDIVIQWRWEGLKWTKVGQR
ncbi:uncharacterized protein EI90DRAFT_3117820 [Cantharellus anzutake]|uniref:uncharacterized protein n=1 Tax=Cantharellus anzutake TaxID=1750568 RepID=UPI0019062387|nr:uncharacterized protein EI90DRAFT_3117820 [Cantharellus anzutake]KAF8338730.1 hypothetical protein EI90DRAFT_3117820 [Cantharellus anzutake]